MSRLNLDEPRAWKPHITTPSLGHVRQLPTRTYAIEPDWPTILAFEVTGAQLTRTVFLPPILPQAGQKYYITNVSAVGVLRVVSSDGIFVRNVNANDTCLFVSEYKEWTTLYGTSMASKWTSHVVTAPGFVLPATASEVWVNWAGPGPMVIVLPWLFEWTPIHDSPAAKLMIYDISGNAIANNIQIVVQAADFIGTSQDRIINTNYGGYTFRRGASELWVTI